MSLTMHEQFPQHDAAVSTWLDKQGWTVTWRDYNDREVFGWKAEGVSPNVTMRITKSVMEDYPPDELTRILERFKTGHRLSGAPSKYTLLRRSKAGHPELLQLDEPPK